MIELVLTGDDDLRLFLTTTILGGLERNEYSSRMSMGSKILFVFNPIS